MKGYLGAGGDFDPFLNCSATAGRPERASVLITAAKLSSASTRAARRAGPEV